MPDRLTAAVTRYRFPQDAAAGKADLLQRIAAASRRIRMAMFTFLDRDIAAALVAAHACGVDIRIILDHSKYLESVEAGLVATLLAGGIPAANISITNSEHGAIEHLKDFSIDGEIYVSGSTNATQTAYDREDNVLFVFESPELAAAMDAEFDALFTYGRTHYPKYQVTA
jgi:phosphatidylserine/phosphatidylglycerophosphate/cardiolipin synthase-like enzyme